MRTLIVLVSFLASSMAASAAPQVRRAGVVSAGEVQERAAQEADAAAKDLEAVATRLEALAKETAQAARDARARAVLARRRANDARKAAGLLRGKKAGELGAVPGSILRAAQEREEAQKRRGVELPGAGQSAPERAATKQPRQGGGPEGGSPGADQDGGGDAPAPKAIPIERDKHAAAKRTAQQNMAAYYKVKRGQHDATPREVLQKTFTFSPGDAPDMADLEIRAKWQWGINIARGRGTFHGPGAAGLLKTGHVDLARLLVRPDDETPEHGGMKWGLRRYNLGDSTVVDCDFDSIPLEHGIYDNLSGDGLYRGNTFHRLGGQAIQIAHRDQAYAQYKADNLPFSEPPLLIVEDCHAADCGRHASKSGFTWTFFDYGTHEAPSTILLRGCTSVHAWDMTRTQGGAKVKADHPQAIRSPGGLVVHQFQHSKDEAVGEETSYAVANLVIDNCLFDHTLGGNPVAAVRGVETILVEDSCFIARSHRNPFFDIDDIEGRPSRKLILENCVSPKGAEVFLRVRKKRVRSLHCPGQRIEIDLRTLEQRVTEVQDDPITEIQSPLAYRRPAPGIHDQPPGHVDDAQWRARQASSSASR